MLQSINRSVAAVDVFALRAFAAVAVAAAVAVVRGVMSEVTVIDSLLFYAETDAAKASFQGANAFVASKGRSTARPSSHTSCHSSIIRPFKESHGHSELRAPSISGSFGAQSLRLKLTLASPQLHEAKIGPTGSYGSEKAVQRKP